MSSERAPYSLHSVVVKRSRLVTPHMKRLTIDGHCLPTLRPDLPAQWFKLFAPAQDGQRSIGRAYTVRRFDPVSGELDIDLFLHGDTGPISAWAERVQAGDHFEISDVHPRSGFVVERDTVNYLLFGDETALPAIGAIIEALPAHAKAQVFAEVANAGEEQVLGSSASVSIIWLHRDSAAPQAPMPLLNAAKTVNIPESGTTIWVAAESTQVSAIRKLLLKERGIDRTSLHAAGYWKRGEADHHDEEA